MKHKRAVLLDTSFFLRFLNDSDPLFNHADDYFRFFLEEEMNMLISTISIAEFCIKGDISELPLKMLHIIPFNLNHGQRAGEFARIAFKERSAGKLEVSDRKIIPNDTKLFAQADSEKTIGIYLSSDTESLKIYNLLKSQLPLNFKFIDLHVPPNEAFGRLF